MSDSIWMLLKIAGGVGIFLYGMNLMSASLEKAAGSRLRNVVEACTRNRIFGVGAGALVTMIIQSSSATTVMTVGFVNAGIMNLTQAAGVIIGANIGTTVTAQIVAFDLDVAAPVIAGIGAICHMIAEKDRNREIAQVFVGFGLLFTGIVFLKDAMGSLGKDPAVVEFLMRFDGLDVPSYIYLLIAGIIITVLVQSSSTVTGIMVAMAAQGLLTINMAVPLILGSNLGTTCTALISGVGANRNAKRAAWIHVIFNIGGALIFVLFLQKAAVQIILELSPGDLPRQIANFHTAFNIVTALVSLPFINLLVKAAESILPAVENENESPGTILDTRMLETPSIAIKQVREELVLMADMASDNYVDSVKALEKYDKELYMQIEKREDIINSMQKEINYFIKALAGKELSAHEHREINLLFSITNDIERMADNAFNIAEAAQYKKDQGISFSEVASKDLKELHRFVMDSCEDIKKSISGINEIYAEDIIAREIIIDGMEREFRERHMKRLNEGKCSATAGIIYLESMGCIERVADRIKKAAYVISDFRKNND
ncbi:MAG: Na/Pi cotransporter family protein [Firmicutes bacterium]|nr:Na/Pi cotransporter family protein [Bacillota bacterium]